jgi:TRAP-type C4-dicarboxylate transport system substrate-binding protein
MKDLLNKRLYQSVLTILALLLTFIFVEQAQAQIVTIKLGSLAPGGSLWAQALNRLQSEWLKASDNKVILKLYGGGSVGDEADMIRKIKFGQLNAAGLTGSGLNMIYPGAFAVQIPRLVHNMDEHKHLMGKLKPIFDKEFQKKDFKVLFWLHTGWVYLFSRQQVINFTDIKNQKMFVHENSLDAINAWKKIGCVPVALKDIDIVIQLQTGGIDALLTSPLYILSYHLYNTTKHMSNLKWAPFLGAVVISLPVWNKISKDTQTKLEEAAEQIAADMEGEWLRKEEEAITEMKKYGLIVHNIDSEKDWNRIIEEGFKLTIENPEEEYLIKQAQEHLRVYRNASNK